MREALKKAQRSTRTLASQVKECEEFISRACTTTNRGRKELIGVQVAEVLKAGFAEPGRREAERTVLTSHV